MLAKTILGFAALAASVSAIMVTSPVMGAQLDFSQANTITWTSVDTDPSNFTLQLVDQNTMTPIVINSDVTTSDDKFTLSNVLAPVGNSYKFNLVSNDPNNSGILAQSQTFAIVKAANVQSSSSSSSGSSSISATSISSSASSSASGSSEPTATASGNVSSTSGQSSTAFNTVSPTGTATGTGGNSTANVSSTASPSPTVTSNAAAALVKTFALGASVLAALLMLL